MSDNNNGALMIAAAAVAIYLMTKNKTAIAATRPAVAGGSKNINGDMWARLLGSGWQNLLQSGASKGTANGTPFVMSDGYGGLFTSDGTPVGTNDPIANWMAKDTGLPALYGDTADYATGAWVSGANPAAQTGPWANNAAGSYFGDGNASAGLGSVLDMFGG